MMLLKLPGEQISDFLENMVETGNAIINSIDEIAFHGRLGYTRTELLHMSFKERENIIRMIKSHNEKMAKQSRVGH